MIQRTSDGRDNGVKQSYKSLESAAVSVLRGAQRSALALIEAGLLAGAASCLAACLGYLRLAWAGIALASGAAQGTASNSMNLHEVRRVKGSELGTPRDCGIGGERWLYKKCGTGSLVREAHNRALRRRLITGACWGRGGHLVLFVALCCMRSWCCEQHAHDATILSWRCGL